MNTIHSVLMEVGKVKPCSIATLYRYIRKLDIKPLGIRQRPQVYPADTASRVLTHLGLTPRGMVKLDELIRIRKRASQAGAKRRQARAERRAL